MKAICSKPETGYCMIELLVMLSLFSIIAQFSWPELKALLNSYERRNALAAFEFDLRKTRAEAMSRGVRTVLTLATDGKSYSIGEDHLPYDTITGMPDSILYSTRLPSGISISLQTAQKIIFNSHGFLSDMSGTIRTATETITLHSEGGSFASATVYPVGVARFD